MYMYPFKQPMLELNKIIEKIYKYKKFDKISYSDDVVDC